MFNVLGSPNVLGGPKQLDIPEVQWWRALLIKNLSMAPTREVKEIYVWEP
jgi:hypothetical protein